MITFSSFDLHLIEWAMLRSVKDHIILSQSIDLAANERERYLQLQIAVNELDLLKRVSEADIHCSSYITSQTVKLGRRIEDLMPLDEPAKPPRTFIGLVQSEPPQAAEIAAASKRPGPVIGLVQTEQRLPSGHNWPATEVEYCETHDGKCDPDYKPNPDQPECTGDENCPTHGPLHKPKHYRPPTDFYAPPF